VLILALETTADVCSLAISDADGLIAERAFRHRMHLSERLMGDVDDLLKDAGVALKDVEGFGVGIGPGSFTGVRIGVTTVKTWACLFGKPVVGVTSLEALATEHPMTHDIFVVPLIRARPGSVYYQAFWWHDSLQPIRDPELVTLDELPEKVESVHDPMDLARVVFLGEALVRYQLELRERFPDATRFLFGPPTAPRASAIAAIAAQRIAVGQTDDPLALAPLYVSPPPIDPAVELRTRQALKG
jgi:tRNA threonylcarbamoyladenosine biosynthesis protein TsaB